MPLGNDLDIKLGRSRFGLPSDEPERSPGLRKDQGIGDAQDGFFSESKPMDGVTTSCWFIAALLEMDFPKKQLSLGSFNKNKLDELGGTGATLDFTQNAMYLVEWGWYGASSARFYAFVVTKTKRCLRLFRAFPRPLGDDSWILIPDTLDAQVLPSSVAIHY